MADNSIPKVLSQMESDLKDINSAREQVENVTKAYETLQHKIGAFVDGTANLSNSVETLIKAVSVEHHSELSEFESSLNVLKEATNNTFKSFKENCDSVSAQFGNDVIFYVDKVQTEVDGIRSEVENLKQVESTITESVAVINALKEKNEILLNVLKTFQANQDKVLDDIMLNVSNANNKLDDVLAKLDAKLDEVANKSNEILLAVSQSTSVIQSCVQGMQSSIQADMNDVKLTLQSKIEEVQGKIMEETNKNQKRLKKYLVVFAIVIMIVNLLVMLFK